MRFKKTLFSNIAKCFTIVFMFNLVFNIGIPTQASTNSNISYTIVGEPEVDNTIDILVNVSDISNLYGGAIDFTYDTSLLEIQSISKGDILGDKGQVLASSIKNGKASIAVSLTSDNIAPNNSGTFVVIKAKILKMGTIDLKTNENIIVKLSDKKGDPIKFTYENKSIATLPSTKLKINSINTDKPSPTEANNLIKISADAIGKGTLTYKFWIHDGTSWTVVQDFSTTDYYNWTPTKSGDYKLWVDVKDSTGEMVSKVIKFQVTNTLTILNITTDKTSPQFNNTTIKFSATAKGDGPLQYRFWVDDGSGWKVTQDFSTKNYYDWTPSKSGDYWLWVDVKDAKGNVVASKMPYTINSNDLSINSFTTNLTSPQPQSTTIKVSTSANGNGTLQYRYWVDDGSGWKVTQDFSTKNYYDWTPSKSGDYWLWVDVKDSTGKVIATKMPYTITSIPLTINSMTTDLSSPQLDNTTVRISTSANGSGPLQYRYWVDDGSGWKVTQDYSTKNYYDWTPSKSGDYWLWVDVKDSTGTVIATKMPYTITSIPFKINSMTTNLLSPQPSNTTIRVSASASGKGPLQYRYWVDDGSGWKVTQDYSTNNYYDWTPNKNGSYWLWVDVKDANGDVIATKMPYTIGTPFKITSMSTNLTSPQPSNTSIRVSTTATGDGSLKYRYWVDDGSGWKITQDYSTKNYYDWTPSKSGDYWLWVDVMDINGNVIATKMPYTIK